MSFFKANKTAIIILSTLAFALYANTLGHEFVLDDKIVITENQYTKQGFSGILAIFQNDSMTGFFGKDKSLVAGGRYRPLSMTMHAIEWAIFGDSPFFYHLINVLLYVLTGLLLYFIFMQFFPNRQQTVIGVAFVATAIFIAHPLHTEVVANIKSRDELLSILLALATWSLLLKWLGNKKTRFLAYAAFTFLLSLLSKESSIVFVGIIPLSIYFFIPKTSLKTIIKSTIAISAVSLIYLTIRYAVIGSTKIKIASELMNNPFLNAGTSEQYATIFLTLLHYIKLSFFPHPLTHDYYPTQIPIVDWGNGLVILSLIFHIGFVLLGIWGLYKKRIWSFIILTYLGGLLLYSNLIFPIGTFMNERFLYVPTIAIALLLSLLIFKIKNTKLVLILSILLIGVFGFKTIDRNRAWQTDETLALTDIEVSSESAKCNMAAGLAKINLAEKERNKSKKEKTLKEGLVYLKKSLAIYPNYFPPMILSGNAYSLLKDYQTAYDFYKNCLILSPKNTHTLQNLEYIAQEALAANQLETAKNALSLYLSYNEKNALVSEKLGELYGKNLQQPKKALPYLLRAHELTPKNSGVLQKIGVAYAMSGDNNESIKWFKKGLEIDTMNARLYLNIGIANQYLGNENVAKQYLEKAFELEPELQNNLN